jgi:uncharacterized protein YbdZ (MbtH family)
VEHNVSLTDRLRAFNRKERFFVVAWALGNPSFALAESFRSGLGAALGLDVPSDAFAAMDYHLDWIYAALYLEANPTAMGPHLNEARINRNQEDVDFLVAYEREGQFHLIMVEAKVETGWTNSQVSSKAERLRAIFGEDGSRWRGVVPHFVLASPRKPRLLMSDQWPAWMAPGGQPLWLKIPVPLGLQRVTRCDADGRPSALGTHWMVR